MAGSLQGRRALGAAVALEPGFVETELQGHNEKLVRPSGETR